MRDQSLFITNRGGGGEREGRGVLRITWFSGGDEGGSDVSNRFYMGGTVKY